jgi:hypothetical protein
MLRVRIHLLSTARRGRLLIVGKTGLGHPTLCGSRLLSLVGCGHHWEHLQTGGISMNISLKRRAIPRRHNTRRPLGPGLRRKDIKQASTFRHQ